MGQVLHDDVLEQKELQLFQYMQTNATYRVPKFGEPILKWTGRGPINGGAVPGSTGQFYPQRVLMNPVMAEIIGQLFWEKCYDVWADRKFQIVVPQIAVGMMVMIQQAGMWLGRSALKQTHGDMTASGFYIRNEQKLYGLCNWAEGRIDPDLPVMIVDDCTNSKGQLDKIVPKVQALGLEILPVMFTFIRFYNNDRRPGMEPFDDVRYIFKRDDFGGMGDPWPEGTYDHNPCIDGGNIVEGDTEDGQRTD